MIRQSITAALLLAFNTTYAALKREPYATTTDGKAVERITLTNKNGLVARIITWGATLTELHAPDRDGKLADVTLGFDKPEPWLKPHSFFGTTAGRFANRIAKGRFTIDGQDYTLATNDGTNHLHGGKAGFDKQNWTIDAVGLDSVRFTLNSPDGQEGYPGKLTVALTYTLTESNELRLDYQATTDRPTVLNLTNHTYWNLGNTADILNHHLTLHASRYLPIDATSIPTGTLAAVTAPMDFLKPKPVGKDIAVLATAPGGGYDHNWILDGWEAGKPTLAAELHDPASGRTLRITTTEPGIQFYAGNYLKNVTGKAGRTYQKHGGLCLETQHFPDSPNQPLFPTTILRPGETFRSTTTHQFGIK